MSLCQFILPSSPSFSLLFPKQALVCFLSLSISLLLLELYTWNHSVSTIYSFFFFWSGFLKFRIFWNFTFLGVGYFCTSINILELGSGMQLKHLKAVWFFYALLLIFIRWDQSRANYSPTLRQDPSEHSTQSPEYSTQSPMNYMIFLSSW